MEGLENLDFKNGLPTLLASICLLLAFHLLVKVGEFLWNLKREKDSFSEKSIHHLAISMEANTKAIGHLQGELKNLERSLMEIPKFKLDMRRLYFAVKVLAGDKWHQLRDDMLAETE